MDFVDRISKVMEFSQTSLENTMSTVREVHQSIIEIPINVAQELGYSEEKSTALKNTHRRVLELIHGGIVDACGEVNKYVVKQAQAVSELADPQTQPAKPTLVDWAPEKKKAGAN